MFDAETGWLIGVTNWGNGRTTDALFSSSWADELTKRLQVE